tara:strand:- start:37879 stop:38091 length:213 start_codon:yes stop_codon:yes gene_type:complete
MRGKFCSAVDFATRRVSESRQGLLNIISIGAELPTALPEPQLPEGQGFLSEAEGNHIVGYSHSLRGKLSE